MTKPDILKRAIPNNCCLAFETVTPTFKSTWHAHPEFEIVYIESGSGCIQYGSETKQYEKGDLFFLGSWVPHEFLEQSSNHQSISLLFNQDFIMPGFLDSQLVQDIKHFLSQSVTGLIFHPRTTDTELDIIKLILSKSGLEQAINLLFLLKKLTQQDNKDVINCSSNNQLGNKKYSKLQDILYFINQNAHRKLLLSEITTEFFMSRAHFCRFFQEQTGKTFLQYLVSLRIERACVLLENKDKPITLISEEVGFDSLSSFNRSFSKLKNMSPRNYRNLLYKYEIDS